MKIKIMQYNIESGFHTYDPPHVFSKERMNVAQKIIKKEDPDILCINEAYFVSRKSKIKMNYEKIFKIYPYYFFGNPKNPENFTRGDVILSKYPIKNFINNSGKDFSWLKCEIRINKNILNINLVHFAPSSFISELYRLKLIKKVLKKIEKNTILLGDFNSLSNSDHYKWDSLLNSWKKFDKNAENTLKDMLQCRVTNYVLSKKLIDSYKTLNKKFNFTIPTDKLSKDKKSGTRIDYIFCSNNFKIISSKIIKNKLTNFASDHYPILSVLEII